MVKKCVYCSTKLPDDAVVDVCQKCGHGIWGEKMFAAIQSNMSKAEKRGDLMQGSVT